MKRFEQVGPRPLSAAHKAMLDMKQIDASMRKKALMPVCLRAHALHALSLGWMFAGAKGIFKVSSR
jgi:hypothetical protein